MILGLTGGIGSGKSTVAAQLKKYGFRVVDADAECRKVTARGSDALNELVAEFGPEILKKNGVLNRKKLGSIVFGNKAKLKKLNSIVQTKALRVCLNKIEKYSASGHNVVFDVPLMFEAGWFRYCDKVLTVSAKDAVRISRTMLRDGCTEDEVKKRMARQLTDEQREEKADFVIRNDKDLASLEKSVDSFIKRLRV